MTRLGLFCFVSRLGARLPTGVRTVPRWRLCSPFKLCTLRRAQRLRPHDHGVCATYGPLHWHQQGRNNAHFAPLQAIRQGRRSETLRRKPAVCGPDRSQRTRARSQCCVRCVRWRRLDLRGRRSARPHQLHVVDSRLGS